MLMSAGLIGMFVTNMRSRHVRWARLFAQTVTFIAVFRDGLHVPGALAPGRRRLSRHRIASRWPGADITPKTPTVFLSTEKWRMRVVNGTCRSPFQRQPQGHRQAFLSQNSKLHIVSHLVRGVALIASEYTTGGNNGSTQHSHDFCNSSVRSRAHTGQRVSPAKRASKSNSSGLGRLSRAIARLQMAPSSLFAPTRTAFSSSMVVDGMPR
jgi:hypothetical protein